MAVCSRCGDIHAIGFCPNFPQQLIPAPRSLPTPSYAAAMQHLGARALPTSGSGQMCLFYALAGGVGRDGLVGECDGQAERIVGETL